MSDRMNPWNRIFKNFKDVYPNFAIRAYTYRPLEYPEIEVMFRDGVRMKYNDQIKRAVYINSETIRDRATKSDNIYKEISNEEYARAISLNILNRMCEMGMNAKDLAEDSGVSYRTVRRHINGDQLPNTMDIVKIARALRCSVDELTDIER